MFFYLHCGRDFICSKRGRTKRSLISALCGNPLNNFRPRKRHVAPFMSRTSLNTRDIAISWNCGQASAVPLSSSSPLVCLEFYVPSVMSEPKSKYFRFCHLTFCWSSIVTIVEGLVVVAIRLHNQQSNNLREEQQQNAKWSCLSRYVCSFTVFPFRGPYKDVHYTPSGFRGQYPLRGLFAVDLPQ